VDEFGGYAKIGLGKAPLIEEELEDEIEKYLITPLKR